MGAFDVVRTKELTHEMGEK